MKLLLGVMLLVFMVTSVHAAEGDSGTPVVPQPKVFKTFKSLPNGVVIRKTVFKGDPRFYVSPGHELTFRTYVYNNKIIAISWQNAPRQLDPFDMTEVSIQGMLKEMKFYMAKLNHYRVVTIFDGDAVEGSSGVLYVPSTFPQGFSVKDLKW